MQVSTDRLISSSATFIGLATLFIVVYDRWRVTSDRLVLDEP
jgi:hypothetical protein